MSDTQYEISDRPVEGDITRSYRTETPQIDSKTFLERLDTLLALPRVRAVVWDQYTPYFNDGDELIFRVNEPRILFRKVDDVDDGTYDGDYDGDEDEEEDNLFFPDSYRDYGTGYAAGDLYVGANGSTYGEWIGKYGVDRRIDKNTVSFIAQDGFDLEPYYDALRVFSSTSEWETVALKNFGDHAEVTATFGGFDIEFYEHD